MDTAERAARTWTAADFLAADQHAFGSAWRYELVDGRIVAHAAPAPDHGTITSGLVIALRTRLRGNPDGCRPEIGSGAAPRQQQRATARIPDVTVRCGALPRVVFEVVSPSELCGWRARDHKRHALQDVEEVREIVEIYGGEMAAHLYHRAADGTWSFTAIDGEAAVMRLRSLGLEIPMAELYEFAPVAEPDDEDGA